MVKDELSCYFEEETENLWLTTVSTRPQHVFIAHQMVESKFWAISNIRISLDNDINITHCPS